jgi:hypothetical protein
MRGPLDGKKEPQRLEEIVLDLAREYDLTVLPRGDGWCIQLPARGNLACRLDIGPEAYDWYVTLFDPANDLELWTEWMDYYGYKDKRSEAELIDDKRRDIAWFLQGWLRAVDIRVMKKRDRFFWGLITLKRVEAEWNHGGTWSPVEVYDPHR